MAVDVREPRLKGAEALRTAYEAKARAELGDADALIRAMPGSWTGPLVGSRIAFVVSEPDASDPAAVLSARTREALMKAAAAMGAAEDEVFLIASRPPGGPNAAHRARRLRLALEAADPAAVAAIDAAAAQDVAAAFEIDPLVAGATVTAGGRTVGWVGEFGASLDDIAAKKRVWSAMKGLAAAAGLQSKGRPEDTGTPTSERAPRKAAD